MFTCYFLVSRGWGSRTVISKQELAKLEDVLFWLPAPTKHNSLVCTSYKLPGTLSLSVAGTVGLRTLFELQEVYTMAASHSGSFGKACREVVVLAGHLCERGRGRLV